MVTSQQEMLTALLLTYGVVSGLGNDELVDLQRLQPPLFSGSREIILPSVNMKLGDVGRTYSYCNAETSKKCNAV
jgi:hypothetical protein